MTAHSSVGKKRFCAMKVEGADLTALKALI